MGADDRVDIRRQVDEVDTGRAYDGDTWSGWLSVSDDFGCVMWEERVEDGKEDEVQEGIS